MNSQKTMPEERFREENINAEEAIKNKEYTTAARILVSIVEKDPENWRAFNSMGILSWDRNFWNDAYLMFQKSVSLNPVYVDGLMNLFDASLKLKKTDETLQYFENALELDPDLEEIRVIRDSITKQGENIYTSVRAHSIGIYSPLIEEAEKDLEKGDLISAMKKYLETNDTEGPNAAAFCGLGVISYHQKRYKDAVSLFVESLKLNPAKPDTYLNLLDAAKECDMIKLAKEIYDLYRKEFPVLEKISEQFEKI
jgi:tetratricopeptide (TPR) repeat protein